MFYFDPLYIIFALPAFIVAIGSSILLRIIYAKYSNVTNEQGITGSIAAQKISSQYNLPVSYSQSYSALDDSFNPSSQTLILSQSVANLASIASVAIAAHEMGHAQQYFQNSFLISSRRILIPGVTVGNYLGYLLIIIGILINISGLAWAGIALFSFTTVFTLLTIPVEADASLRGLKMIKELNLLNFSEIGGAKLVLTAAALTYIAAAASSLSTLLYFILRVRGISTRRR